MKEVQNKVQYIATSKLKPHPNNPRRIDKKQLEILKISVRENPEYFETRPILCNAQLVVFAGNMRLRAAKESGIEEVPVVIMDISPEKEKELLIRDNKQNGAWDFEMLANDFEVSNLLDWGFEAFELVGGEKDEEIKEGDDEAPSKKKESSEQSIKIIFKNKEDLENARVEIDGLSERYAGSYYVIEGGDNGGIK